jgi:hypothetical protein
MPHSTSLDLETVQCNVLAYRKSHPSSKRLPPIIWSQILPLLQSHPLAHVASVLVLGQSTLARKAQKSKSLMNPGPHAFLEIPHTKPTTHLWELELPGGIKLRGLS